MRTPTLRTGPIRGPEVHFQSPGIRLERSGLSVMETVMARLTQPGPALAAEIAAAVKPADKIALAMSLAGTDGLEDVSRSEILDAVRENDPTLYAEATREAPADDQTASGRLLAAMATQPGKTGAEVLDAIRESDPRLYAEAVAGYGDRAER